MVKTGNDNQAGQAAVLKWLGRRDRLRLAVGQGAISFVWQDYSTKQIRPGFFEMNPGRQPPIRAPI
jgi:hypothetical protein